VALKVLLPRLVHNEERLRRIVFEAKTASSLNHPGIVTIYQIGSSAIERDGVSTAAIHFIAMERVDGHTLAEQIHIDKENLRRRLGSLAQAADGIAKAHAARIVHHDLKPSNTMVSRDGFAKVLDFGLAKLTVSKAVDEQASAAPTRTGVHTGARTVMGTVGCMSPEQVQGKPVDHRSDICSFGCIRYEALTRRRAFEAHSAVDTRHKILHDAPVESYTLNPKAPTELRRQVRHCLTKSPDQRLQSMKDLAIDLREIADNYESLSSSTSSGSGVSAVVRLYPSAISRRQDGRYRNTPRREGDSRTVLRLGRGECDSDPVRFDRLRLTDVSMAPRRQRVPSLDLEAWRDGNAADLLRDVSRRGIPKDHGRLQRVLRPRSDCGREDDRGAARDQGLERLDRSPRREVETQAAHFQRVERECGGIVRAGSGRNDRVQRSHRSRLPGLDKRAG
jgi:serine/threonine protein kinase